MEEDDYLDDTSSAPEDTPEPVSAPPSGKPEDDWEPYVAPKVRNAQASAAPSQDDWEPYSPTPKAEGMLGTFTREVAHGAGPAAAGAVTGAAAAGAAGAVGAGP